MIVCWVVESVKMAYAAAVYLLQVLKQLQQSDQFSTPHYPKSQINDLLTKISSLKVFLEKNSSLEDNSESTNLLEAQIRDAVSVAEDVIESNISAHFLSSGSADNYMSIFCDKLQRVVQEIDSIAEETKKVSEKNDLSIFCEELRGVVKDMDSVGKMAKKFRQHMSILSEELQRVIRDIDSIAERTKKFTVEAVGRDLVPASMLPNHGPFRGGEGLIVGRHRDIEQLMAQLIGSPIELEVVPILGIAGVGKTALAKAVFNDQLIASDFATRAWIKVSREYHKRDILLGLLRSMEALGGGQRYETDEQLAKHLYDSLKSRKYLVVLDDVCDVEAWNYLKELLPDYSNGSRVVLTTRDVEVARVASNNGARHEVHSLGEIESWDLFKQLVFPDRLCPELEQVAKNVARKCRGLPLAIVIMGRVLAKAGIRGWQTAASSISVSGNYEELIEVVLSLTYRSLPQYFKACLLYMGIFPNNYEIPVKKLVKLWIAEGFLESNSSQTLEKMAKGILLQLVDKSLVSVCQKSSRGRMKTCMIDDVYRDFVRGKAEEEKVFFVINKQSKAFLEEAVAQRRLCILKSICFGKKELEKYNTKKWVAMARSVLYSGPIYQHQLSMWLDFKLLRVLDALNIHFYSFPLEILKSVQLRYLAFTYNGELPASIFKLHNLQFLIILRNLSTKYSGDRLYLPVEIWNMKELRHLQFMGGDLPSPLGDGVRLLENLLTLSDVTSHSCTPLVLEGIPNLKTLEVRIESPAHDGAENFSFLSHLHILRHLESLKCVVVRPDFGSQVLSSIPAFPPSLRKLCLSGCGFSWDYTKLIARLPNLEVLKLQNYSFRGSEWILEEEQQFNSLKFLLLEDMDVEKWLADETNFPLLERLIIRHCYKLQEIPCEIGDIPTLRLIELDDCNPSAMRSVRSIQADQQDYGNFDLQVRIPVSWNDH